MFTLPDLPYGYDSLEPFLDEETMHVHHDKHHAGYVKKLNDLLAGNDELLNMDIDKLLKNFDKAPDDIRQKVINNAGGVANHNMFWKIMCPPSESGRPLGKLEDAINSAFGSFVDFQEKFSASAGGHFGSGWAWLIKNKDSGSLKIITTQNQDSPVTEGKTPILCLDVWEHAYYLKYRNMRVDYIKAWWNVINWKEIEKIYNELGGEK